MEKVQFPNGVGITIENMGVYLTLGKGREKVV